MRYHSLRYDAARLMLGKKLSMKLLAVRAGLEILLRIGSFLQSRGGHRYRPARRRYPTA